MHNIRIHVGDLQLHRDILRHVLRPRRRFPAHDVEQVVAHQAAVNGFRQRKAIAHLHTLGNHGQHLFASYPDKVLIVRGAEDTLGTGLVGAPEIPAAQVKNQPIFRVAPDIPFIAVHVFDLRHTPLRGPTVPSRQRRMQHFEQFIGIGRVTRPEQFAIDGRHKLPLVALAMIGV